MTVALLTFLAAATLLIVAPGPDTLLVTRNVFRRGRRGGLVTAAGTVTGLALWSVAAWARVGRRRARCIGCTRRAHGVGRRPRRGGACGR